MLYIDDNHLDKAYFEGWNARFERHSILGKCEQRRIACCVGDAGFSVALCLYLKSCGAAIFPLPVDMPLGAARRRAERAGCEYLFHGQRADDALDTAQVIPPQARPVGLGTGLIQTSSGTTGEPKYVERSWSNIDQELTAYLNWFSDAELCTPVVACPINHSYGLISGVLSALERGAQPVVVTNLNPKYILRRLQQVSAPLLYSSPMLIAAVTRLVREGRPLFSVMTSGTTLPAPWFAQIQNNVRRLHQQYGCSEIGCVTLGWDIAGPRELGTVLPHLTVHAGDNAERPSEIVVRQADGRAVATRDLGYFQGETLHFASRMDDTINLAGLNVYPAEVEEVVLQLPGVRDAVVYGGGRGHGTDQVCLRFVAEDTITSEQIRRWCGERLSRQQIPMVIRQVPSIPRMANGKISRRALTQEHGPDLIALAPTETPS